MAGRVQCAQCVRVPGMHPCIAGLCAGRAHVQQALAVRPMPAGRRTGGSAGRRRRLANDAVHHQFGVQRVAAHRLAHIDLGQAAVATVARRRSRRSAVNDCRRGGRRRCVRRRQTTAGQLRQTRAGERSLVGGQRRDTPQVDQVAGQIVVRFVQHRVGCEQQWRTAVHHDEAVAASKVHVAEGQLVGGRLQVAGEPAVWVLLVLEEVLVGVVIGAVRFCLRCEFECVVGQTEAGIARVGNIYMLQWKY